MANLVKKNKHCRVCDGELFNEPLLHYKNMPSSAQGFPTKEMLSQEKGITLEVFQCSLCGLVQLDIEPVSYYRDVIRASSFSPEMGAFRLQQFKDWVTKYELLGRRVLEIGCGRGEYLSLLQASGVVVLGLEHAKLSIQSCQNQGLSVLQGYLGEDSLPALEYEIDAFICLNFMEHWPDPNKVLQSLCSKLTDGAIGLIEVPNFDMIVRQGVFSEFISDHLLYFTEDTLKHTLQRNGFEILECNPVWHDYILSVIVKKRTPIGLSLFQQRRSCIRRELHAFISQFSVGNVAIWGAGHQALAVIALMDLAPRIAYVIDSAPFKQGKFTLATHLPIVSPDFLDDHSVDAVIVMVASYSDEVVGILKDRYGKQLSIAVLRDSRLEIIA